MPQKAPTAAWTRMAQEKALKRSSLCVSTIDDAVYVFGGELQPRQPRDNLIYTVQLGDPKQGASVKTAPSQGEKPSPRVGAATTTLNGRIYMFSGRGGEAMAPIDEQGSLWRYDPQSSTWTSLQASSGPFPEARSYHCMTSNSKDSIYVHAGCPEKGRLSDLWVFKLASSQWTQLASAPDPPRGGASIAYVDGKLYRMNGFDGEYEQGGDLDVYDVSSDAWASVDFTADGVAGPGSRSVATLVPLVFRGSSCLITMFGEQDPSALGHQGAGKMLDDAWIYDINDCAWSKIRTGSGEAPPARGWFDADVFKLAGKDRVIVVGGLAEDNERLDDVWVLDVH